MVHALTVVTLAVIQTNNPCFAAQLSVEHCSPSLLQLHFIFRLCSGCCFFIIE